MIRSFRPSDLDDVIDVWHEASLIAHSFLGDEFLAAERIEVAERWIPMAETTVYEFDGRVVGFLSLIGNEVGAVFVRPEHQRSGIGGALMDGARAARPFLEVGVFELNDGGRRFYEDYGFTQTGRQVFEPTGHLELRLRLD